MAFLADAIGRIKPSPTIAVTDKARGERVVILYIAEPGVDAKRICQILSERKLPNLWIPRERDCIPVAELPIASLNKLNVKRLKEIAVEKTSE